jgi:hypothetical protein
MNAQEEAALVNASLTIRDRFTELRELARATGHVDAIDRVLEAAVALERITQPSQAPELNSQAARLYGLVEAAKPYLPGRRLGQTAGRSWDPAPADKLSGLAQAAVALAAVRAGIQQPKAYVEPVVAFGA